MKDQRKTKQQLIDELARLRRRVAALEAAAGEPGAADGGTPEGEEAPAVGGAPDGEGGPGWADEHRRLLEKSLQGIVIIQQGRIRYVNPALAEIFSLSAEEMTGVAAVDLKGRLHPDDRDLVVSRLAKREAGETPPPRYEFRVLGPDGSLRWVEIFSNAIPYHGKPAIQAVFMDNTERRAAEALLRESEENFRRLAENASDGILIGRCDGTHVFANRKAAEILGYSREELLTRSVKDLAHPDDFAVIAERLRRRIEGAPDLPNTYEIRVIRRDGSTAVVEVSGAKSFWRGGPADIVFIRDVSERRMAEDALKRRNEELTLLCRAGRAFISTLNLDQVLRTTMEEMRHVLGQVSGSVWLLDRDTREMVCRCAGGPLGKGEKGRRVPLDTGLVGSAVRHGKGLTVADTRTDERCSDDVCRRRGARARSVLAVPLHSKNGVIGVLQALHGEPDRFQREDVALVESLASAAAMAVENARLYEQARRDAETRAVLLGEVNHRVKNNLTVITGLLYTAQRLKGSLGPEDCHVMVRDMANRVQGLATVHNMLANAEWAPLPLSDLATQMLRSALRAVPEKKNVAVSVSPSPVRVSHALAHHLAMMINELATNTVKHVLGLRDDVTVEVRIAGENGAVRFEYRDDGPGYPEDVLKFEGFNLGLDLVQDIVQKSLHGDLDLRNDGGAGAEVSFRAD